LAGEESLPLDLRHCADYVIPTMAEDTPNPDIDASAAPAGGEAAQEQSENGAGASESVAAPTSRSETLDKLWEEIGTVVDPEIGISITELGLIYDVQTDGDKALVTMTLTSMGCPVGPQIQASVHGACIRVDGIEDAEVEIVFSPSWNPREMASEEAQMMLGIY
jgi:metal-sulfur cluster biosynthetic enzyme